MFGVLNGSPQTPQVFDQFTIRASHGTLQAKKNIWSSGRHSKFRELSDNATRRRGIPPFLRPPPQHLRSLTYWRFAIGSCRRRADALEILPPHEHDGHRGRVHEKQRKETERPRLCTHVRAPFRNGAGILLSLGRAIRPGSRPYDRFTCPPRTTRA